MSHLIMGLAHIGIKTLDTQKSLDFYTKLLGFQQFYSKKMGNGTEISFIRAGGCIIELICSSKYKQDDMNKEGTIAHVALEVINIDDIISSLKKAGIDSFQSPSTIDFDDLFPLGSRIIFFKGPSGEIIELFQYSPK